tara:strand:- start:134 stop:742 length:609 start_codon:yes stop_codon:yes gene_type:complete
MIKNEVTLGFSGASGAPYGWRLLQVLTQANIKVSVVMTAAGTLILKDEIHKDVPGNPQRFKEYVCENLNISPDLIEVYSKDQWYSPLASGSGAPANMIVCPCSVGCLSAIATGASNNLLERAADVVLKERGKLILVVREMPLSEIHLNHMLTLSRMGVSIMPPNPGFYYQPQTVEDLIDFVVAKILDQLDIEHQLIPKWGRG